MTNQELLKNFGEYIGIRDLKLNQQGCCQLIIDESKAIIINEITETQLLFSAIVGKLTEKEAEAHALELLSMNMLLAHVDGPYLSWEPQQKMLLVSLPVDSSEIDVIALEENISYLLQNVEHIYQSIREKEIDIVAI